MISLTVHIYVTRFAKMHLISLKQLLRYGNKSAKVLSKYSLHKPAILALPFYKISKCLVVTTLQVSCLIKNPPFVAKC